MMIEQVRAYISKSPLLTLAAVLLLGAGTGGTGRPYLDALLGTVVDTRAPAITDSLAAAGPIAARFAVLWCELPDDSQITVASAYRAELDRLRPGQAYSFGLDCPSE